MSFTREFEYLKPKTIDETVEILAEYGAKAHVLAGGTDLIPWIRDSLLKPDALVDIKGIDALKGIKFQEKVLYIGALVTFSELIDSQVIREKFPLILEMAKMVASKSLRNRATMVGNICSGVPSCDSGPVLLVYDVKVLVKGPQGDRRVSLSQWFLGPKKTALKRGEVVRGVALPLPKKKHAGSYVKLGRYRGEDLAQASVAILALSGNTYKVAFGAVAPTPVRARRVEAQLNGKRLADSVIEAAKKVVSQEVSPITDIRASKEYRMHMLKVMLERGVKAAAERLSGDGPTYGTRLI